MDFEGMMALIFVMGMFSGVFIVFMGLRQRSEQLQMQHRERMAMIERGQIPIEMPAGRRTGYVPSTAANSKSLSIGIVIVGLGMALMVFISVAAESPEVGIGLGGAIAILGSAFIVRSMLVKPQTEERSFVSHDVPSPPPISRREEL